MIDHIRAAGLALVWCLLTSLPFGSAAFGQSAPPGAGAPSPAAAAPLPAGSDIATLRASLDSARAEIEQAEATFKRQSLTQEELADLRTRLDPVTDRLRDHLAEIGPKLEAARARLQQLGPKPKDGAAPEGPDVARDRADREAAVSELDEINRLVRALLLQAEQLTAQVSDRRRSTFASELFHRSYSLLSPSLWVSVGRTFPRDLRALNALVQDAYRRVELRATPGVLTILGLVIGVGLALHLGRRHLVPRLVHRKKDASGVSPLRKLLAAWAVLAVATAPAALGSFMIYQAFAFLDVLPPRLLPVVGSLLVGAAFLAFLHGLIDAVFAPDRPAWRLVELSDRVTGSIESLGVAIGGIVVFGRVLDGLNQAIFAGLPLSLAVKAVIALAAAITLAVLLRRLAEPEVEEDACLGPYIPTGLEISGPIRMLGWLIVALVAGSVLAGYVAFGSFLLDQLLWASSLAGLLYLGVTSCDRLLGGSLKENSRVSTALQTNLGLRRRSLQQIGVLLSGAGRVVLTVAAILLALAPWGVESGDILSDLRAAFFGFKLGDVTISLSTIMGAIGAFAVLFAVTRMVQRWLTRTFLPTTELDSGLRNSIATAAGYLGFFAAVAAAFGSLGLSLDKIAIVAGALSVGIGFGLQSIVNNFVSGLILLWERPIRVGDLVVVGDGEGYVRRISVRATEIETFDRSTVIVPNSNLISGVVKNRVRNDNSGRVILPVNVLRNQDPARAAELMLQHAGGHPDVLQEPPPRVNFRKIGETWLEFDLVCYVDDVTKQLRVQSDLNFSLFKALTESGILPALGPGAMNVGGLEPVQTALQSIADALGTARAVQPSADGASLREAPRDEEEGSADPPSQEGVAAPPARLPRARRR